MSDVLFGDEHVQKYEETDGEVGHVWQDGVPTLILTTTGRKTGEPRKFALIYQTHGDAYVVVASKGGAPDDPGWYKNLVAHPNVKVQVGAEKFDAVARTASAEEKAELWPMMAAVWPSYDDYKVKTSRDIPVVLLDPA
ncbi:deazaflavin-dependent oxidoreductase (nitroreductase family) [Prauserella isguenensis]|uniref:Deazaflavin-dependent oxidoreductase (Nitroreductase family) n=1 Tax=Prauserella isguenensis TaxID=1470180 RepID=A0A839S434_9PSEU|nr:nitroreductase family deazaflavin-dependent oxidoreductase [Prauserella isguenensis]MBB3052506.1 deazaflavin-dependent oxidoreductase (nitroreductase family) [Prauserella isguenensis]